MKHKKAERLRWKDVLSGWIKCKVRKDISVTSASCSAGFLGAIWNLKSRNVILRVAFETVTGQNGAIIIHNEHAATGSTGPDLKHRLDTPSAQSWKYKWIHLIFLQCERTVFIWVERGRKRSNHSSSSHWFFNIIISLSTLIFCASVWWRTRIWMDSSCFYVLIHKLLTHHQTLKQTIIFVSS